MEKAGRDSPTIAIVGHHGYAFLIVAYQRSRNTAKVVGIEADAGADRELQHGGVRPHLLEKAQALDDPAVEVDEFGLGELINVYGHGGLRDSV